MDSGDVPEVLVSIKNGQMLGKCLQAFLIPLSATPPLKMRFELQDFTDLPFEVLVDAVLSFVQFPIAFFHIRASGFIHGEQAHIRPGPVVSGLSQS